MEICRQTALKKKWCIPVREKWDAFTFIFVSILSLSLKKKERDQGRNGGENKMANVWIRAVGEELLEKRSFSVIRKHLFADLFLAM